MDVARVAEHFTTAKMFSHIQVVTPFPKLVL
jgi:hypothetical protein